MNDNKRPKPTSDLEWITPEIAEKWLDAFNSGNRKKRARAIAKYSTDMAGEDWLITGDSIRFDWDGRLVDGQHRLSAIVKSGVPVETFVVRGLNPKVREVIDQNVPRNAADALGFNGVEKYRAQIAASLRVIFSLETGQICRANSSTAATLSNSQYVEAYYDNPGLEDSVAVAMSVAKKCGGTPTPVAVAHYILDQVDSAANAEFWESASTRRTNGIGDPRNTMCDALGNRLKAVQNAACVNAYQLFVIFKCWNAWREGKELKSIRSSYTREVDGIATTTFAEIPTPK